MCKERTRTLVERLTDILVVESTWLLTIYLVCFISFVVFSIVVLADESSIASVIIFSTLAFFSVLNAAVLRLNEAEEDWLGLDRWLAGHTSLPIYAVLAAETLVAVVYAGKAIGEVSVTGEAEELFVGALFIGCLSPLFIISTLLPVDVKGVKENEVELAVLCLDISYTLQLTSVGLGGAIRPRDIAVLSLLLANMFYLEVDYLVKTSEEENEGYDAELEVKSYDSTRSVKEQKMREREAWLTESVMIKRESRAKLLAHHLVIVAFFIPIASSLSLRNALSPGEGTLVALPVLAFTALWATLFHWLAYRGTRILPSLLNNTTRDMMPLIVAVVWNGVLAGEASLLPSLPEENRLNLFVLYAICAGWPLLMRLLRDITLRPRVVRQGGRKNDCSSHALFRSALADTLQYYVEERPKEARESKIQNLLLRQMRADAALVGFCYYEFCYNVKSMLSCLTYFQFDVTREPDYKDIEGLDSIKTPNVCCLNWHKCEVGPTDIVWLSFLLKTNFLDTLDLTGCDIGKKCGTMLIASLETNTSIRALNLTRNRLLPSDVSKLGIILKDNTTIEEVILDDNDLEDETISDVVLAIIKNSTLKGMSLAKGRISHIGANWIANALKSNRTLTYFSVRENRIGNKGAQFIAKSLEAGTSLVELDVRDNEIRADPELEEAFVRLILNNRTLTTISGMTVADLTGEARKRSLLVDDMVLHDFEAGITAALIENNVHLRKLELPRIISELGAIAISKALEASYRVRTLNGLPVRDLRGYSQKELIDLSGRELTSTSASFVAYFVTSNRFIRTLLLNNNRIGDEGAGSIAKMLISNHTLHHLFLDENDIGSKGAKLLAEAVKKNEGLRTLSLRGNMIRVDGLRAIDAAISGSTSLNAVKVDKRYLHKAGSHANLKMQYL